MATFCDIDEDLRIRFRRLQHVGIVFIENDDSQDSLHIEIEYIDCNHKCYRYHIQNHDSIQNAFTELLDAYYLIADTYASHMRSLPINAGNIANIDKITLEIISSKNLIIQLRYKPEIGEIVDFIDKQLASIIQVCKQISFAHEYIDNIIELLNDIKNRLDTNLNI